MECLVMILVCLCVGTTCRAPDEKDSNLKITTKRMPTRQGMKTSCKDSDCDHSCNGSSTCQVTVPHINCEHTTDYGPRGFNVTCSRTSNTTVNCTFGNGARNSGFCFSVLPSNDCEKLNIKVCVCHGQQGKPNCKNFELLLTSTPSHNDLVTKDYGISSTELVKITTATPTPEGVWGRFVGIGIGLCFLVLIILAIAILVAVCRGQRRERPHNQGVNWDDQGYMGVEIKRRVPQSRADATGHVMTGGFSNQTYEDEIAVGIRGGSSRTITPVVPPVPASPGGVPLTPEGYVEYNPKSDQIEDSRTASGGGLKCQKRPLPTPNTTGSYEGPYEEIKDLFTSGRSASSAELQTFSIRPQQVGSSGHNAPIQASIDRSRSTGYVDVDYPDPVFEITHGPDGKNPCSVDATTSTDKASVHPSRSTGYVDVDYPDPVFETTHGSEGKNPCPVDATTSTEKASVPPSRSTGYVDVDYPDPVFETTHGSDGKNPCSVDATTSTENASVHPSRSTGYVDVDYPDPVFETTHGSDGKDPCSIGETTPSETCDGHLAEGSGSPTYFILEQPPTEPKLTDSDEPAQTGGTLGRDGSEKTGDPFEVATEVDGKPQGKETVTRAPSPLAVLTVPRKTDKRQTRSMSSAYSKLDRGPLWRGLTK